MATLKLTSEQLIALRALAAKDVTLAGLLPTPKERDGGGGVEQAVGLMVFRNPLTTVVEIQKQFPQFSEQRAKFLRRQALNYITVARSAGRWNETVAAPVEAKPETGKPAKKAA